MKRFIPVLIILSLFIPLTTSAEADDALGPGVTCNANRGRPFQEVAGQPLTLHLSSYFSVNCQPINSLWRIVSITVDMRHGSSGDGSTWGPYSNESSIKTRSGPGVVQYNPMRDDCDTGGLWRFYRQRAEVDVASFRVPGGLTRHDTIVYFTETTSRLQCGVMEKNG